MRSTAASGQTFATALFIGLLWGIVAAAAIGTVMTFAAWAARDSADMETALRLSLETAVWTSLGATVLAIFPMGPIAAIASWPLYRRGIVAPWAYAGAGAFSAIATLLLICIAAVESMRYPTQTNYAVIDEGALPLLIAGFAALGAFGGFMAGRIIRRRSVGG